MDNGILPHLEVSHAGQARIAAQALLDAADRMESGRKVTEEERATYHREVALCDVWATLDQLSDRAARHGWDAAKFARDVWGDLYDPHFGVWHTSPVFSADPEGNA